MLVIPAIDIYKNKCVRLYKGDYKQSTIYSENPIEVMQNWEFLGAKLIHIVDLEGAKLGKTISKNIIKKMINDSNVKIQIGGGVRTLDTIEYYLSFGIKKVILGTAAIKDENNFVSKAIKKYGFEKIAVSLDTSKGKVKTQGWTKKTNSTAEDLIKILMKKGVKNFIYTDIEKDGTFQGISINDIKKIRNKFNINLTIAGGISSESDLQSLDKLGIENVIIGKALYENKLNPNTIFKKYKG